MWTIGMLNPYKSDIICMSPPNWQSIMVISMWNCKLLQPSHLRAQCVAINLYKAPIIFLCIKILYHNPMIIFPCSEVLHNWWHCDIKWLDICQELSVILTWMIIFYSGCVILHTQVTWCYRNHASNGNIAFKWKLLTQIVWKESDIVTSLNWYNNLFKRLSLKGIKLTLSWTQHFSENK